MKNKFLAYSIIVMSLAAPANFFLPGAQALAASGRAVFDNGSNVGQYKKTIKKDMFYLPGEKFQKEFDIGGPKPKIETPVQDDLKRQGRVAAGTKTAQDENFKVEAIIKIGEKGCAIINSKIWRLGRSNFGYMLMKLNEESVEIKTPAGNVIKCELIKKKAVEMNDE